MPAPQLGSCWHMSSFSAGNDHEFVVLDGVGGGLVGLVGLGGWGWWGDGVVGLSCGRVRVAGQPSGATKWEGRRGAGGAGTVAFEL